jgi:hypothetical protein
VVHDHTGDPESQREHGAAWPFLCADKLAPDSIAITATRAMGHAPDLVLSCNHSN